MKTHHVRAFSWIVLIGLSASCAQRYGAEAGRPEPSEATQETPPGVPAVVPTGETDEPGPPVPLNQDVPPGVAVTEDEPGEAGQEAFAAEPARADTPPAEGPATVDTPPVEPEQARPEAAGQAEGDRSARAALEEDPEVRELLLLGPTYTPNDRAPRVIWDTEAQAVVSRKLLPVLQSEGLPARTRALFWLLVRPDGTIADVVPQTPAENARFDAVAEEVVRQLRFTPAIRSERVVPVWVIQEISLLMQ